MNPRLTNQIPIDPFFDLSADLLCIAGYDGYFKRINPSVSNVLEYSEEELYSRPIHEFIHEDDKTTTAEHRQKLLQNNPLLHFENRYVTKSGKTVWLSWTSMPNDKEQLVYAIAKNITHKKVLEEERNSLLGNMTQLNKELKHLNYTASHDLRSPVNNLLSVFDILDTNKITDQETLHFINILQSATHSLKNTLNNYVDILSQKEHNSIPVEEIDLQESLELIKSSLHSIIQNTKTSFIQDFEIETVMFNKAYLQSIFLNLITNAIKYAKPGLPPMIELRTKQIKGYKQLSIKDNGIGFDTELVKDKLFGMHQKFHNHSDSKGIGLYLVHNYISSFHGKISVESKVNEGTTFTILFKN